MQHSQIDHNVCLLLLLSGTIGMSSFVPQQYYYVNENKTWLQAQSYCRAIYTDLATVDSTEDMKRLTEKVDPGYRGAVWIGLRKKWTWSTGGDLSNFTGWYKNQPNEGNQEAACGVMTNQQGWHDWFCSFKFNFVCLDDTASSSGRYILINSSMTWKQAQIYCRYNYTDLASIHNAQEHQQVHALSSSAWIGLISEQWSDKQFTTFRNWAQGQQPASTVNDTCVSIMMNEAGKWYYRKCDLQNPFICYGGLQPLSRHFYFVKHSKTWIEAQKYCRMGFTDLATIDSLKDMQSVMNAVDSGYNGSLWIGLMRVAPAHWGWSRGNELLSNFSNWDLGRPDGSGQCVLTVNGVWRDYSCTAALYFVCYNESSGYILVQISKNWYDAQSYCRANNTDLASIRSPWEQEQLTGLAGKAVSVWVGLFLDNWQWSDQWSLLFRNWADGQPSSGTGNCSTVVTFKSGKWTADDCTVKHPFICHGMENKMITKKIIRVKVSSNGNTDLNSSPVQAAILKEIEKKLKGQGMSNNAKLTWRKGKDSKVFVQEGELKA